MKKKTKIITISIVSFIVLGLASFCGGVILNGTCFASYKETKTLNNWMKYISDDKKLIDLVIPGSHDSGTIGMNWLGNTQNYSIKEQLDSGARYFDIRVNKESEDKYVIFHGPINGVEFKPILDDIKDFIVANPSETIILDFQHFKNDSMEDVKNMIDITLNRNNLLLTKDTNVNELEYVSNLKLKDTRGKCIAYFPEDSGYSNNLNYIFSRGEGASKNVSLNSYYESSLNKLDSTKFISEGLPTYLDDAKRHLKDTGYKGLFVLQSQLTDGMFIFGPYAKEKGHDNNLSNYIDSLRTSSDLEYINIIMRDFVSVAKSEQIIALNTYKI